MFISIISEFGDIWSLHEETSVKCRFHWQLVITGTVSSCRELSKKKWEICKHLEKQPAMWGVRTPEDGSLPNTWVYSFAL